MKVWHKKIVNENRIKPAINKKASYEALINSNFTAEADLFSLSLSFSTVAFC